LRHGRLSGAEALRASERKKQILRCAQDDKWKSKSNRIGNGNRKDKYRDPSLCSG
jgi:hypothetical protein